MVQSGFVWLYVDKCQLIRFSVFAQLLDVSSCLLKHHLNQLIIDKCIKQMYQKIGEKRILTLNLAEIIWTNDQTLLVID